MRCEVIVGVCAAAGCGRVGFASLPFSDARDAVPTDGRVPTPFCASLSPAPMFCDDFDDASPPMQGWNNELLVPSGAALSKDGTSFVSAPSSLLAVTPSNSTGNDGYAELIYKVAATVTEAHATAQVRVDQDGQVDTGLVALRFGPSSGTNQVVSIDFQGGQLLLVQSIYGGPTPNYHTNSVRPLALDTWVHVQLDVLASTSPATANVTVDGQLVLASFALDTAIAPNTLEFLAGIVNTEVPSQPWTIREDNATLDWQ